MAHFTPEQRQYIKKHTKVEEPDPSEEEGELNIIPFLDITTVLIIFLLMMMMTVAFFAQIEAQLPTYQSGGVGSGREESESLNLNITITDSGVIVSGSGGKLAPGCKRTAEGRVMTVPKKGDKYDWDALTECAAQIQKEYKDENQVTVQADPTVQFQHVVRAMDAMRNKGDKELFPDVLLSAGVR